MIKRKNALNPRKSLLEYTLKTMWSYAEWKQSRGSRGSWSAA